MHSIGCSVGKRVIVYIQLERFEELYCVTRGQSGIGWKVTHTPLRRDGHQQTWQLIPFRFRETSVPAYLPLVLSFFPFNVTDNSVAGLNLPSLPQSCSHVNSLLFLLCILHLLVVGISFSHALLQPFIHSSFFHSNLYSFIFSSLLTNVHLFFKNDLIHSNIHSFIHSKVYRFVRWKINSFILRYFCSWVRNLEWICR